MPLVTVLKDFKVNGVKRNGLFEQCQCVLVAKEETLADKTAGNGESASPNTSRY